MKDLYIKAVTGFILVLFAWAAIIIIGGAIWVTIVEFI